jgi:hypothetical protein
MKALLSTILFSFFTWGLMAQTPQAVCYQALAKDNNGNDLSEQQISVRATILKGEANGQVIWQETHTTETDFYGLFTVNIGEGNFTGGLITDFSTIQWGDGAYWLRIEFDANGGGNYVFMGASRILSVPYALYAERSKVATTADEATSAVKADTALIALSSLNDNDADPKNELQKLLFFNDSLLLVNSNGVPTPGSAVYFPDYSTTNEIQTLTYDNGILSLSQGNSIDLRQTVFGGPGASSDFPQGIIGEPVLLMTGDYTVPSGKVLYLSAGGNNLKLKNYGSPALGYIVHPNTPNMPILPAGTNIADCMCTGLLLDTSYLVKPVIIDLTVLPAYVVPNGKVLFVKSGLPNDLPGRLILNGIEMEFFRPNFTRGTRNVTLPEGTLITKPTLYPEMVLTGYLIDKS